MISVGDSLDARFPLTVVEGGVVREVAALADLLTVPTLVSVYMKANTASCDRQVAALAADAAEVTALGYRLIALSRDTPGVLRSYAQKKSVPFLLASDPQDRFARAAGSVVQKSMYGRTYEGPARAAFVLGPGGLVRAVIPKVDTRDPAGQLRAVLRALQPEAGG